MIEYYESATHLDISGNTNLSMRVWEAFNRMLNKVSLLYFLSEFKFRSYLYLLIKWLFKLFSSLILIYRCYAA